MSTDTETTERETGPIQLLRNALETLERVPCQFWACDGPDEPFVSMKTCYVCAQIQDLRKGLAAHGVALAEPLNEAEAS